MPTRSFGLFLLVLAGGCGGQASRSRAGLTVSVAASLQNAMGEVKAAYQYAHPDTDVSLNFGASGTLARQVEQGAPVDVFFSASAKPMDELASKGLILPETRRDLVRNEVVLIAPREASGPDSFQGLADRAVKLIALGEPQSVPAGDYGRQVLRAVGVWEKLQSKLVLAKDVRQVLTYVEQGEADAGIVYATDARDSSRVRVTTAAPAGSHDPVLYPIAVIRGSPHAAAARAFVSYLEGPAARAVFVRHGFTPAQP